MAENIQKNFVSETNSQNMQLLKAITSIDLLEARGGGEIVIVDNSAISPEIGPAGTIGAVIERPINQQISVYVVRQDDTLSSIAKMFGVSVNTILWANDLKSSVIHEGDTLIILPISGVLHKVLKGETLASIAKKYKADIGDIVSFNDLDEDTVLAAGTEITIPDGEIDAPKAYLSTSPLRGSTGPAYEGYYIRPIAGGKTQSLHGYNGIDLSGLYGTPIVASASGVVIISKIGGWNGGYGTYIVINHDNGTQTLYAHNSANIVFGGERVVRGQVIGYVGSTGKSTGPHVHFEVRGAKNPF